jgi:hypothetical protein
MIKVVENKKLLKSNARIIVQLVNEDGDLNNNIPSEINYEYHHVNKEYIKFINYCQTNRLESLGKVQYIPEAVWALGLVDTLKNDYVNIYDKGFKYIACAFCKTKIGKNYKINYDTLKECLRDVFNKAQSISADVAIIYSDIMKNIVSEIFNDNTVNVYLYKED